MAAIRGLATVFGTLAAPALSAGTFYVSPSGSDAGPAPGRRGGLGALRRSREPCETPSWAKDGGRPGIEEAGWKRA